MVDMDKEERGIRLGTTLATLCTLAIFGLAWVVLPRITEFPTIFEDRLAMALKANAVIAMVLLVVLGLAQLVQLWLNTLTGNRPPTLLFLVPVPISALLWPWVFVALQGMRQRFAVY